MSDKYADVFILTNPPNLGYYFEFVLTASKGPATTHNPIVKIFWEVNFIATPYFSILIASISNFAILSY